MFFNAEYLDVMLKTFALLVALVVCLLAAHAIWVWRLARSLRAHIRSNGVRIVTVALAASIPLVSYYVVGSLRRIGETASGRRRGLVPLALVAAFAALWLISGVLDVVIAERAADGRLKSWRIGFNWALLAGSWFLAVFMIVRVFSGLSMLRSIAIAVAVTLLSLAILIAPYP